MPNAACTVYVYETVSHNCHFRLTKQFVTEFIISFAFHMGKPWQVEGSW